MKKIKNTKISKTTLDIVPIRMYDEEVEGFILQDGSYMDIFKVIPKDVENLSESEILTEIVKLVKLYKTVKIDLKFVMLNFPLHTQMQKDTLEKFREKCNDEVRLKWLNRQILELCNAEKNIVTKDFYLFFYADNKELFVSNKNFMLRFSGSFMNLIREINKDEKIHILKKIGNMNTVENIGEKLALKPNILEKKHCKIDVNLFNTIQPRGGVDFSESSYIKFGDGYVRCLRIYDLPTYLNDFWQENIFNTANCIYAFDVATKDDNYVKRIINKSIAEETARANVAKNYNELYLAEKRKEELQELYDSVMRLGEVVKVVDLRIFVLAKTLKELEERTAEIIKKLEGNDFKATALLNEQKSEWLSLYTRTTGYHENPLNLKGLNITSEQLGTGFPFTYSELVDSTGVLLGTSKIGGVVLFDLFTKTYKRQHYNAIVCGDMGSGKSTHLKKMFKHNASVGNYVRTFDASGEFTNLTQEFGGKIINCREGILNPLEILQAGEDDSISYAIHINKLVSFFKCILPHIDAKFEQIIQNELSGLYNLKELTPRANRCITALGSENYPTLSDFLDYLQKRLEDTKERDKYALTDAETHENINELQGLVELSNAVKNLVANYGYLFNGITTIKNIDKEKIVTFDISHIKDLGNIFTAQMQLLVSLCWDNAVNVGKKEKAKVEANKDIDYTDITKFLVLIDEAHEWVNSDKPQILDMLIRYMREARKYFAGIVLASQSVRDFIPTTDTYSMGQISKIFELSQYKFMFKQDASSLEHIRRIFGENLTENQILKIPFLEIGDTILSIAGDRAIEFNELLFDYEDELFNGGR